MRILKYLLYANAAQTLWLPIGAKILTVQVQHGSPQLWALVDETRVMTEERIIGVYTTGETFPNNLETYIATFQLEQGAFVFHAFELRKQS